MKSLTWEARLTVIGCSPGLAMQNILAALLLFSASIHLSQVCLFHGIFNIHCLMFHFYLRAKKVPYCGAKMVGVVKSFLFPMESLVSVTRREMVPGKAPAAHQKDFVEIH